MGRLPWRERWSALGCRRGWWRLAAFLAFPLVGYLALYGWLRVTGGIDLVSRSPVIKDQFDGVLRAGPPNENTTYEVVVRFAGTFAPIYKDGEWPRLRTMKVLWPAVKLEIALDRRGWSPLDRFTTRWSLPPVVD